MNSSYLVCKIPLLARATIGYLVYKFLPSPLDDFFDRQSNKISYQNFLYNIALLTTYQQCHYTFQEAYR